MGHIQEDQLTDWNEGRGLIRACPLVIAAVVGQRLVQIEGRRTFASLSLAAGIAVVAGDDVTVEECVCV